MSDSENDNLQTINQIKQKKKINLSDETKEKRKQNMLKALEARKNKHKENKKVKEDINLIGNNIHTLLNNSDSEEEIKPKKEIIKVEEKNNDYSELRNTINKMNEKIEKLYLLKKTKLKNNNNQPLVIEKKNVVSNNLLQDIRNKMLNQL